MRRIYTTINNIEYLDPYEQILQNKKDIEDLDLRVDNIETDVSNNMAVPMIGSATVLAFDVEIPLGVLPQGALKNIIIANHANYEREKIFGLVVSMTPNLVDDVAQFPLDKGNVSYNTIFTIGARQLLDIGTDTYHYVAVATSIDKRFQIEWTFNHATATYVDTPVLIVRNLKPEEPQVLEATYDPLVGSVQFAWELGYGDIITYQFEIFDYYSGIRLYTGEVSTCEDATEPSGYLITTDEQLLILGLGKVKAGSKYETAMYLNVMPTAIKSTVRIKASDNRPLTLTTMTNPDDYRTSVIIRPLNFSYADSVIINGSPSEDSNFADKQRVGHYIEIEKTSQYAPTVTIDSVTVATTNKAKLLYIREERPGYITTLGEYPKSFHVQYNQTGITSAIGIDNYSVITFTFPNSPQTQPFGANGRFMAALKIKVSSPDSYVYGLGEVTISGFVVTVNIFVLSNSISASIGQEIQVGISALGL